MSGIGGLEAQPLLTSPRRRTYQTSFPRKINRRLAGLVARARKWWWQILLVTAFIIVTLVFLRPDVGILLKPAWTSQTYPALTSSSNGLRILHIKPGKGSRRVECELNSATFADEPTYTAISYTWGRPSGTKWILVNGRRMTVKNNLFEALHALRHMSQSRAVWVDAICIDQDSVAEKSRQVALMNSIYSRAQDVAIWLGVQRPPKWVEQTHPAQWRGSLAVDKATEYWNSAAYWIYRLIHQEYWKRAWVVQEVAMASSINLWFGGQSVPWSEFLKLVRFYDTKVYDPAVQRVFQLERLRQARYADAGAFTLPHLLDNFQHVFSTNRLDQVYSFAGMASRFGGSIAVDYSKSIADVYQDFVMAQNSSASNRQDSQVEMVYNAALVRQRLSRQYVSRTKHLQWFGLEVDPNSFLYQNCGDELEAVCLADKSGNITANLLLGDWMRMFKNGVVSFFSPSVEDLETVWLPSAPETKDIWLPPSPSDIQDIQIRGVLAGVIQHIGPSYAAFRSDPDVSASWMETLSEIYADGDDLRRMQARLQRLEALVYSNSDLTARHIGHLKSSLADSGSSRLFVASNLVMGLQPPDARVGDAVYQFWNSSASLVLRWDENEHLEIVGRSAVVGNGTDVAWDAPLSRDAFRQDSNATTLDLMLDIEELTRLSLDTVVLQGTSELFEDDFPVR